MCVFLITGSRAPMLSNGIHPKLDQSQRPSTLHTPGLYPPLQLSGSGHTSTYKLMLAIYRHGEHSARNGRRGYSPLLRACVCVCVCIGFCTLIPKGVNQSTAPQQRLDFMTKIAFGRAYLNDDGRAVLLWCAVLLKYMLCCLSPCSKGLIPPNTQPGGGLLLGTRSVLTVDPLEAYRNAVEHVRGAPVDANTASLCVMMPVP